MAMFDDPKKELKKLEAQLLKDEEWFERELEAAKKLSGYTPAPKTKKTAKSAAGQRSIDQTQVYRTGSTTQIRNAANNYGMSTRGNRAIREEFEKKPLPEKKEKGVKGLVILACMETLGIVAVVAYWLMFLL